jgi:hypothetical protein
MPCLKDGPAGRREVNAPLLAQIVFASHADYASSRALTHGQWKALQALLPLAVPVV